MSLLLHVPLTVSNYRRYLTLRFFSSFLALALFVPPLLSNLRKLLVVPIKLKYSICWQAGCRNRWGVLRA